MTLDEVKAKKEKALKLLETHEDEYRVFYAELTKITTVEELRNAKVKRDILALKADTIHTEIRYLEELEDYRTPKTNENETVL